ncbi:hypothetical protein [Hymenobacter metallilatus]|uniref:Uncharacterized protein n=1 Tax=Hymenobacter metallilatus TaxID=2493666 RepID=A0A428IYP1_9BACT|nr:hypothetical protein [Hymenobacter metallilatus]RSK24194.1 hypothetical protein EI290_20655 [Hymenobacter metallilatus]
MAETRSQSLKVILPAGTPTGTYQPVSEALDSTYARATGVVAYANNRGGLTQFQLGIHDDTATYVSQCNSQHLEAGIDCPKPLRNTPVAIVNRNQRITVQVYVPELLTDTLDVDVVFTLER